MSATFPSFRLRCRSQLDNGAGERPTIRERLIHAQSSNRVQEVLVAAVRDEIPWNRERRINPCRRKIPLRKQSHKKLKRTALALQLLHAS
jgi:hypothetical protein